MVETAEKMGGGEPGNGEASLADSPQKKSHLFQPGWKGGPGRPKGSVSPSTRLRNEMAEHGEKIFKELMRQIDSGMAKPRDLIGALQFIVGPVRSELGGTVIPGFAEAKTYRDKLDALLEAQTSGVISPDTGKTIMDTLRAAEEASQLHEIQEEIRVMKAQDISGYAVRIS